MSVPILLVTGFLGAGKTSFINDLLQGDHGLRIAAIVNDFGSINIDAALLDSVADGVIGLKNGCICCSLQGDLLRTLKIVLSEQSPPEMIVIEASGVADPAGIVQSLIDPVIWQQARLETVVCIVDAPDAPVRQSDPLWQAQVRGSDLICLSKTADLTPDALSTLRAALTVKGKRHIFDLANPIPLAALFVEDRPDQRSVAPVVLRDDRFARLEWQHDDPVDLAAFQDVIKHLAPTLLRAKGFLQFHGHTNRMVFQLAGTRATLARAPDSTNTGSQLILIGERGVFDPGFARDLLEQP